MHCYYCGRELPSGSLIVEHPDGKYVCYKCSCPTVKTKPCCDDCQNYKSKIGLARWMERRDCNPQNHTPDEIQYMNWAAHKTVEQIAERIKLADIPGKVKDEIADILSSLHASIPF